MLGTYKIKQSAYADLDDLFSVSSKFEVYLKVKVTKLTIDL